MKIDQPGDITIRLQQHSQIPELTADIDFACWGPFTPNSTQEFIDNLCCGFYPLNTERHNSNTGYTIEGYHTSLDHNYPYGNLVDCSYDPNNIEYCHIHNAHSGEYYLLMITNYSHQTAQVTFYADTNSTATTDCHIMNEIHNDGPYCEGDTIHLFSDNPLPHATYSWTGPNGWTSTQMHPVLWPVNSSMDGAEFHMVMTQDGIVSDTGTTTIHLKSINTSITVSPSDSICEGHSVTLSAECDIVSEEPTHGNCTYTWLPVNQHTESITVTPQQDQEYTLLQTFGNCTSRDSVTIHVIRKQANIVASDTEICAGDTVILTAVCPNDTLPCTYFWSPGNNTSAVIIVTPSTTSSYALQQTFDGCIARDTVTVQVHPPAMNVVYLNLHNHDFPFEYENQTFNTTGTYQLHLSTQYGCDSTLMLVLKYMDSVYVFLDSAICSEDYPVTWNNVTFLGDSIAQVTHFADISENGTDSIIQMTVTTSPNPIQSIIPEYEICSGHTLHLTVGNDASSDIVLNPNTPENSVNCFLTGPWITSNNNTSFTITFPNNIVQDTSVSYQLEVSNQLGCIFDTIIGITVLHAVTGDTSAAACGVFNWHEHRNIRSSCDNLTHTFQSTNMCDSVVTLHLTIYPLPDPCFNYYSIHGGFVENEPLHFMACSSDLINYHWNMGNGDVFDEKDFDYTFLSAGTYAITLEVTDQNGCVSSRRQIVVIRSPDQPIYIPNSFTPNGDGLNDIFKPTGAGVSSEGYLLTIYDKWGTIVFQSTDPENGWDGTYQGVPIPNNSVMSYTLRFIREDGLIQRKGAVVVLY